jgi:thiosulfate/3-mercaptopyruvate sulfurtransferase
MRVDAFSRADNQKVLLFRFPMIFLISMVDKPRGSGDLRWVSTEWLEEHLGNDLTVLDTQPDCHDYFLAHIPGSVELEEKTLRAPLRGLPAVILQPRLVASLFGRVGISNDKPVVIYTAKGGWRGWGDGLEQCMVAYVLLRMGHKKVYLLDGGMDKWIAEGRRTSQVFPRVKSVSFKPSLQEDFFLNMKRVKELKDKEGVILLDARPSNIYRGEAGPWIKLGHIPGAVNLPWASLMDEKNKALLKPLPEIKRLAEEAGATKDKMIICSCGTGREATNEFTIFRYLLGYPRVSIYEGSWTEWSSRPRNPVVKGSDPR